MGIKERYILHEGLRLNPYRDIKGHLTGGIGHLMLQEDIENFSYSWSDFTKRIFWDRLFISDYFTAKVQAIDEVKYFPYLVSNEVLEILTELKFNMGPVKFNSKRWPKFFNNMMKRDYEAAAYELLHNSKGGPSQWSLDVKSRSKKIADELRSLQ